MTKSKFNLQKGTYHFEDLALNHSRIVDFWEREETYEMVEGDKNKNVLRAASNANYMLLGFDDDDTLIGSSGNDWLEAGLGDDLMIFNGGRDLMVGMPGADTFIIDLAKLSTKDTAYIADFKDVGDNIQFVNVDPHLNMDIGIDNSIMIHANLGSGERGVVAVLGGMEGNETFAVGHNSIQLVA